jgi:hypothetical protein
MTKIYRARILALLPLTLIFAACSHQETAPSAPPPQTVRAARLPDPAIADAADRAVERSVREILELAGISTFDVFVRSRQGRVLLTGNVPSAATAASLVSLTRHLKNVRAVREELDVQAPAAPAPVLAESEGSFSWGWPLLALFTLIVGYVIGRRRNRKDANSSTTNARPADLRQVAPPKSRAS